MKIIEKNFLLSFTKPKFQQNLFPIAVPLFLSQAYNGLKLPFCINNLLAYRSIKEAYLNFGTFFLMDRELVTVA